MGCKGKKKKGIVLAALAVVVVCSGCEQLKPYKDDVHNYIIKIMDGKND